MSYFQAQVLLQFIATFCVCLTFGTIVKELDSVYDNMDTSFGIYVHHIELTAE